MKGDTVKPTAFRTTAAGLLVGLALLFPGPLDATGKASEEPAFGNPVLEWNQIFIDTLIATSTPNSSSQRLGAIVHTAIFDALNGIDRRYAPLFVHGRAHPGISRRGAVIAAAYTALAGLFPSQQPALDASYASSLAALTERCGTATARVDDRADAREASSAVANGGPRWLRPCSPGGRPTGSARPTPHSRGARRSASGGRHRQRLDP